jgi:hypothetical protein
VRPRWYIGRGLSLPSELDGELIAELDGELVAELDGELAAELAGELAVELAGELAVELAGELAAEFDGELVVDIDLAGLVSKMSFSIMGDAMRFVRAGAWRLPTRFLLPSLRD